MTTRSLPSRVVFLKEMHVISKNRDWVTPSCAGMVMENNEFILAKVR